MANIPRGYAVDTLNRFLLIPILKCGSRSVLAGAKPLLTNIHCDDAKALNHLPTIASTRHPCDRLVSALYSVLMDARSFAERVEYYVLNKAHPLDMNSHVRPQWYWLKDFRVDYYVRMDHAEEDWAKVRKVFPHFTALKHFHIGAARPRDWRDVDYDWQKILHIYQGDLDLCPDWSV